MEIDEIVTYRGAKTLPQLAEGAGRKPQRHIYRR